MAGLRISAAGPIRHRPTPPRAHAPQRGEGPARARSARADARRIRREQRAMGLPVPAVGHRPDCCTCARSEEHTSELQSQSNLVCRLLLEKKKKRLADGLLCTTYMRHIAPSYMPHLHHL